MIHLHKFSHFVQAIYEARTSQSRTKTIVIVGLPGSGKTMKAKEIMKLNPGRSWKIYDDFESEKALPKIGRENQIISDGLLTLNPPEDGIDEFREVADIMDSDFEVIYFENDPESAKANILRRWESGKGDRHQRPERLLADLDYIAKRYQIPPGAKTIPVYKA